MAVRLLASGWVFVTLLVFVAPYDSVSSRLDWALCGLRVLSHHQLRQSVLPEVRTLVERRNHCFDCGHLSAHHGVADELTTCWPP